MLLNPSQARDLFSLALDNHFAILAVNADSPAAMMDCLIAAKEMDAPIIIETSLWQLESASFGNGNAIRGLSAYLSWLNSVANSEEFMDVPVLFHTDHIKGPKTEAILTQAVRGVDVQTQHSIAFEHIENMESKKVLSKRRVEV